MNNIVIYNKLYNSLSEHISYVSPLLPLILSFIKMTHISLQHHFSEFSEFFIDEEVPGLFLLFH